MILAPKAAKGYTDAEKLKTVAWGKGFKRIYFLASAIWMGGIAMMMFADDEVLPQSAQFAILVFILAPIPVYFFIKWIFSGFKKEEKKKK